MTDSEIVHAKARAKDCLNGFMEVRMQQARDVVKLAEALQAANSRLDVYFNTKPEPARFDSIFDSLMKGKKP